MSEAEQYVLSAYQLDSCIQSSGLFSYFELQTAWAAKGVQATGVLGLTGLNQMLVRALSAMSLPSDATEAQIAEATRRLVGESEEFAGLLDHFEQLEDDFFYQADAPVADAIVSFAVINHDALLRAET
ncbi:MAG: hypothetical protein CML60_08980 [Rhodobacteraceae bacterium]|nr:hypothetical protein [Paracoccaceae bacterium]MBT26514.1 hypothetical protein [Paracoccaceae bacterium]